ncbi:hypothetical protein IMF27_05020 [Pseudomonas sp. PCH199]|uniref:hypothetical protein n=1 Tax=unclassified Pseudomonas TaxID=196821 RepID=UPI000BDC84A1|nr:MULTISPECIES: hypothetical protein [unclassified Pseudomonas]MCW8275142.1 hypothetical protein [Pseudomonas sp. PCH199]PAM84814.1 hypothetical protein CES87_05125 [Pseudomonas sp. ERMR1:02]
MNNYDDITVTFTPLSPGDKVEGCAIVQFDDNGKFVEAHAFGNFAEKIEGGVRVTRPDGSTITMKNGDITIEDILAKSVGIRDLSEVKSFAVRTVDQTRIYCLDFFGGGYLEVVYSQDGQMLELTSQNLKQTLTNDNEIIVRQGD